ncbi:MAG: succinyl-diaminopimelate desuccinylase [Alphaproteobacteria bacterium]|nr:succinyl-diaminopimelate desuccinylase [Alphaproteobacteria bacterium]
MTDRAVTLAKDLIACPSVTPEDAGAQVLLAKFLEQAGFTSTHLTFGEGVQKTPNLFARIGNRGPHLCYGGHTDVVPPGPESKWTYGPFTPHIEDGILYGRGASDMKGSVAAFAAAAVSYIEKHGVPEGSISLLITGDEEGEADYGTVKVLEWLKQNNQIPDVALVGEPTNPDYLGQEVKIGRRGSLSGRLRVMGRQGHVAYPQRADNPMPRLIAMLSALQGIKWDEGTEFFPPTNFEITTVDVGNKASNVIPGEGNATFNIRFNDLWTHGSLQDKIRETLGQCGGAYEIIFTEGAHSFITQPGAWSETMVKAVEEVTGHKPAYTTNGGTSDARFFANYCPVVEFGGVNETVHRVDENAKVEDLQNLAKVFERLLEIYFSK